jgi:hypothetical protein
MIAAALNGCSDAVMLGLGRFGDALLQWLALVTVFFGAFGIDQSMAIQGKIDRSMRLFIVSGRKLLR